MEENTEFQGLPVEEGSTNEGLIKLEFYTAGIHELVADMITREVELKEAAVHRLEEKIAELEAQLLSTKEEVETKTEEIEQKQSLIGALSRLVNEQETMIQNLKEEAATKESEMKVLAASLEEEQTKLQKQIDILSASNEQKRSLIQDYKDKIDSLRDIVVKREVQLKEVHEGFQTSTVETSNEEPAKKVDSMNASLQNEPAPSPVEEDKEKLQKAERKSQKKKLKQLLKKNPHVNENDLAEQLGVDSSTITKLRKEYGL